VDFDPNVGLLRINGKVSNENQYVKVNTKKKKKWSEERNRNTGIDGSFYY
jgi:hypothetical protein